MTILNMDSLDSVPEEAPVLDDNTSFEENSPYLESGLQQVGEESLA